MFGYVKPDVPYLYYKDGILYKAMYCGLCKGIGKCCGQCARLALSYDVTFLSALLHNIAGEDVLIERKNCAAHPFRKRPIAKPDRLTVALGAVNTLMTYYKLTDDVNDGDGGRLKRLFFKKGYKKASASYPQLDAVVKKQINELSLLEKQNSDSIDRVADSFGTMFEEISALLLEQKSTQYTKKLFYYIAKWLYLTDALDDVDKDIKSKSFNVFVNAYGCASKAELIKSGEPIRIFNGVFAEIAECNKNITYCYNNDLTDNVLLRGMPLTTGLILRGEKCDKRRVKLKQKL